MDLNKMLMDYASSGKENQKVNEIELETPVAEVVKTKEELELENFVKTQIRSGELVLKTIINEQDEEETVAYLKGYQTPLTKLMTFADADMQFATDIEKEEYARFNKENNIVEVRVNTMEYLDSMIDDVF